MKKQALTMKELALGNLKNGTGLPVETYGFWIPENPTSEAGPDRVLFVSPRSTRKVFKRKTFVYYPIIVLTRDLPGMFEIRFDSDSLDPGILPPPYAERYVRMDKTVSAIFTPVPNLDSPPRKWSVNLQYGIPDGKSHSFSGRGNIGPIVKAHRHPNGGGWVADTAFVDNEAFVGPDCEVFGNAAIHGSVKLLNGARVYDNAYIRGVSTIDGSEIYGNAQLFSCLFVDKNSRVYGNALCFYSTISHSTISEYTAANRKQIVNRILERSRNDFLGDVDDA